MRFPLASTAGMVPEELYRPTCGPPRPVDGVEGSLSASIFFKAKQSLQAIFFLDKAHRFEECLWIQGQQISIFYHNHPLRASK